MLTIDNTTISQTALSAMASTALEFDDEVVKRTNPLLIEIFQRIESGNSTHEQEIEKLFASYLNNGTIYA